jgi:hypothetical protein
MNGSGLHVLGCSHRCGLLGPFPVIVSSWRAGLAGAFMDKEWTASWRTCGRLHAVLT